MGWTRLDDNVLDHPKIVGLSLEAECVFYRSCVYVNRQQSQGFIPAGALAHLARGKGPRQRDEIAAALVAARLWHEQPGGWEVHDWQQYARPARNTDALREAGARGGRRSVEIRTEKYGSAQPGVRLDNAEVNSPPEATPEAMSKPPASKPPEARATGRDGEGSHSNVYVSQSPRAREAAAGFDAELIDSQNGDRVLFEAQLLLEDHAPLGVEEIVRRVAASTGRDEQHVRAGLRAHQRRFSKLPDGRLTLSEEALR
jgi:hypothetical protein